MDGIEKVGIYDEGREEIIEVLKKQRNERTKEKKVDGGELGHQSI